jgi:hypothetical protein
MRRPYYTRIALLGLGLYLFFVVVLFIVALTLQPSEWEYPLIVGAIASAIALAVYLWQPWGLIVGVLGGIVGFSLASDSFGENIASPDSVLDFAYRPVFCLAGSILLFGGSVAGLVRHFRRSPDAGNRIVTRLVIGLVSLVVALGIFSTVVTFVGVNSVSATDRQGAVSVVANNWGFDTKRLQVASDGSGKVVVDNRDPVIHTFTVAGLGIDVKVGPRSEKLIRVGTPGAGTYEFHCRIAGHESMRGVLTVQ